MPTSEDVDDVEESLAIEPDGSPSSPSASPLREAMCRSIEEKGMKKALKKHILRLEMATLTGTTISCADADLNQPTLWFYHETCLAIRISTTKHGGSLLARLCNISLVTCGRSIFDLSPWIWRFEVDTEDPTDTADPTSLDPAAKRKVGGPAEKVFLMLDNVGYMWCKKTKGFWIKKNAESKPTRPT